MNQIAVVTEAQPFTAVEVAFDDTVTLVEVLPPPVFNVEVASAGAMGPQGIQGETGPQGPKGDKGNTGQGVIGGSITVGPTPPPNPGVNDVWIDTT